MKKFLIVISFLLLAGAGYFTYEKWVKHSNLSLWSFVPSDAALVIEADVKEDISKLESYPLWNIITNSSGFKNFREGLTFLDSINGKGGFTAIFDKAPTLTSAHKVSNTGIDFLFIVELQNISQNTFTNAAIGRLQKSGLRFKTRSYNDFKISEISNEGKTLTFIFYKNFFLASFTPYLVEDAIRAISDSDILSFKEKFETIDESDVFDGLKLYANFERIPELIGTFSNEKPALSLLSGSYSTSIDSTMIQVSGFTDFSSGWFGTHVDQPSTFDMAEIVPENTAYFLHITSSTFVDWKTRNMAHLRSSNPAARILQDSLKQHYDFHSDQVFDLLDSEIGIANLESSRAGDQQKLIILEVKDIQESLNFFSRFTERIARARGDSVYTEPYSENEIRFLPVQNFPSAILGKLAGNFEQCFYMNYKNYLIFSNDLQRLKDLIQSIQDENTWGKSIRMNDFLERTNNAANVSLYVNVPRSWATMIDNLKMEWVEHFKKNASTYQSVELLAFQFSYLDGRLFTNYTMTQPLTKPKNIPKSRPDDGIRFVSQLISKPHLLKTHSHRNFDMIVQDSSYAIYYMDPSQNALWTEELDGPIQGKIHPIDYYKNGKIQYLMATNQSVYILDRTGAAIPGFPKKLPSSAKIAHLNLIDYDLSRNYRIGVTDTDGNIYLTNKDLKLLDGWNPKTFDRNAVKPLQHFRLGGRDLMLSIQENGVINVLNRRGEFQRGFPFDTKQSLHKNYFVRSSNSPSNSSLTVISEGGELIEMNLEGDVIKRDQLIKTSPEATFQLIPDTGKDAFIIVRKEGDSYEVLDDTGNLLFQKNYLSQGPILIQYYQFGAGRDLIIFVDKSNRSLYIYDKSGNLITGSPLNSEHEVSLIYSGSKRAFQVFSTSGSNLERYSFNY